MDVFQSFVFDYFGEILAANGKQNRWLC